MLLWENVISCMIVQIVWVTNTQAPQHILQHSSMGKSATLLLHFITIIAQVLQQCEELWFRRVHIVLKAQCEQGCLCSRMLVMRMPA